MNVLEAIGLYVTGIVVGAMLTLWWQTFAASIRRQAWENVSKAYDRVLK
jgi:hypothetical protein